MRITSIETTPNPNSMKVNVDEQFDAAKTYTATDHSGCPDFVSKLLEMTEIQSVFVCQNFITLNKNPKVGWQEILHKTKLLLTGDDSTSTIEEQRQSAEKEGQVQVLVQTFKGIPIQVKVIDQQGEARISLGSQFNEAAMWIQDQLGADFLKERYWADHGVRYGGRDEVAEQVADELRGKFDNASIERTKAEALGSGVGSQTAVAPKESLEELLRDNDWHKRLIAVEQLSTRSDSIDLLADALLKDSNPQVRRLAAAALGASGDSGGIDSLCHALLKDDSVGVRRTAGDALSDIGDVSAQSSILQALKDPNKLVRWRAARFLSDIGTREALSALDSAKNDGEFEVRLEIEAAIDRITSGDKGMGPAWRRIAEQTNDS